VVHEGADERRHTLRRREMRKVTAGLFHSIDGVVEAPDQWQFDAFDAELGALLGKTLNVTDTVILGRVGYEQWSHWWPNATADEGFAKFINTVPKHVASRTLTGSLSWQNSHLIEGDVAAFVRDLKGQSGGEIAVMAGITIVRYLFLCGLLDELTLITHPVIAGAGRRHLFQPGDDTTRLMLKDSIKTSAGNVVSTYALRH
jgi:dihydrofolate reductase